jgi:hypothetical protein
MGSPRRMSAIEELDLTVYGGPTNDDETTIQIEVTNTELIGPNPDRIQYWITNNGPSTIYWSTIADPSISRGHVLGAGQVLIVRARDDGSFCGRRLYATANAAPSIVTITQVERAHRGG